MIINSKIMVRMMKSIRDKRESTDKRMVVVTEALSNIKIIKLFAWQKLFEEKIQALRKVELKH